MALGVVVYDHILENPIRLDPHDDAHMLWEFEWEEMTGELWKCSLCVSIVYYQQVSK